MNKIKFFISYAHDDKTYFNSLKKGILEHKSFIEDIEWNVWDDGEIGIGHEWHKAIQNSVKDCQIAILLISPAFFNSQYIKFEEFTKFIERIENEDNFTLFPILIRECRYDKVEKLAKYQIFLPKGEKYGFPEIKDLAYSFLVNDPSKSSYLDRYHMQLVDTLESTLKKKDYGSVRVHKNFYGLESIYKEIDEYQKNHVLIKKIVNNYVPSTEYQILIKLYENISCEIFSNLTSKRKNFNFHSLALSTLFTETLIKNIHHPKYTKLDEALNATISLLISLDSQKGILDRYKEYFKQITSDWYNRLTFNTTIESDIEIDENIIINVYLLLIVLLTSSKKFALELLPLEKHHDLLSSLVNLPTPSDLKYTANNIIHIETSAYDISQFIILNLIRYYIDIRLDQINETFNSSNREFPIQYNYFRFIEKPENWNVQNFTADTTKVINILMGKELYGENSKDVWFREIFQNAIDACNSREKIDISYVEKKIQISFYSNKFTIKDNGIGMSNSHISRYFCKVGRSIWRSEDLKQLEQNKSSSNLISIGKFGVGFLSVFQIAKSTTINTRFCFEEFSSSLQIADVNEPFFIERGKNDIYGTEITIELSNNYDLNLSNVVKDYLVYKPLNINVEGLDMLPKDTEEAIMLMRDKEALNDYRWLTSNKYLDTYEAHLTITIPLSYRKADKRPSRIKVTNGGILIFSPSNTWLGKETHNSNNELGSSGLLGILDFVQGKAPITVSRNKISLSDTDAGRILEECRKLICNCWEEYALEIRENISNDLDSTDAILNFLKNSCTSGLGYHSQWNRNFAYNETFNNKAKELLIRFGYVALILPNSEIANIIVSVEDLINGKKRKIIIVVKSIYESSLFKVYISQAENVEFLVVSDEREARLFSSLNINWMLILDNKDLWKNINIEEIRNWKLCDIMPSEFAIVPSSYFLSENTFITVLPNRRIDISLLDLPRSRVSTPPRILINQGHKISEGIENLSDFQGRIDDLKAQFKLLHLSLEERSSEKRRNKNYQSVIDKLLQIAHLPKGVLANLEI